jgi:tetratricopeptide (TPR) repeat protein
MMAPHLRACLLLMGTFAAGLCPLRAQPCTPRALIVGVSTYKDPEFSLLLHARNDAIAFRDWFQTSATCGTGSSAPPALSMLTDEQATQTAILRELNRALLTAGRNDEVFIFISARGMKTPDYGQGYLLGYDGVRGKLHPSGISVENLRDAIPFRGVARVFLFADISRDLPNRNEIVSYLQASLAGSPALAAVLSARPKQVSSEGGGYAEGIFTHFLMEGLKPGRKISLEALYQELRKKVLEASRSKQEPMAFGDDSAVVELMPRERILLASLSPPPPALFADQEAPSQPPLPADIGRALDESAALEQEAQTVLLRYGEGNQFPDDPQRPQAGDFSRAGDLFAQALRVRPALPSQDLDRRLRASFLARSLFCKGRALAYSGDYDGARSTLEQARDTDPRYPEPYNAIGVTYLEEARFAAAVNAFRESIHVAPDWAYPRHNLALAYIEMGDYSAAEAAYREAIRRSPLHPYLYYNLGILLQRLNRGAEAESLFRSAIRRFEEQSDAYRKRAAGLGAGNTAAAAEAALARERADTVLRNEGEPYNALGALWQARGKGSKAQHAYDTALRLNPALYAASYNLGVLALRAGRYSEAVDRFRSVIANLPQAQAQLDCAQKGVEYQQSRDAATRRRLKAALRTCRE